MRTIEVLRLMDTLPSKDGKVKEKRASSSIFFGNFIF